MKIIVTETQAKRLNFIKENTDIISQFEQFCKTKIQELNTIYNKVTSLTVAEIVNLEISISDIYSRVDRIENELNAGDKKAYAYIEQHPEPDLDLKIDNAHSEVNDKITSLQLIIMELEKLQELSKEHKLSHSFKDNKPLDITSRQN